jgi:ribonuclease Z
MIGMVFTWAPYLPRRYAASMLQLAGTSVDAISVAGMETCIVLPSLKLAFDIGRGPKFAVACSTVLFTHAHIDHMGGLAHHVATRSLLHMKPPTYVVPAEVEDAFHNLLDAFRQLDGSELPCRVIPANPGDAIPLGKGRTVRAFRAVHVVPALGYSIWQEHHRLRPDLVGQSGENIRDARARGEQVSETFATPIVAFTGDSCIDVLDREPVLCQAKLLMMEVSFLDDRVPVAAARKNGHIHLDEVIARADLFENEAILFTHLSARYRQAEAQAILDRRLPEHLKRRVTLLPRPSWVA